MVASTRFPVKPLVASVGLSVSLTLLGCSGNQPTSSSPQVIPLSPQTANNMPARSAQDSDSAVSSALNPSRQGAEAVRDWTSDRVLYSDVSFSTQAFSDSIKPNMTLPAVERESKSPLSAGGFANDFAKNLPGSESVNYLPNIPALINTTSYFLTSSEASTNFYALQDNGQIQWQLSLHENGEFIGSSPAVAQAAGQNYLYAITNKGRLYAVNASTGIVAGFADIPEGEFENNSPFAITDGTNSRIYLASYKGRVYRYDFNGSNFTQVFDVKPVTSALSGRFSASPVVTNSHIYLGSEEGKVYKLNRDTGASVSNLDLSDAVRSEGCQIKTAFAIDALQDVGVVSCGSYLYKIRLNDNTSSSLSLAAQSPLLELQRLIPLNAPQILGPNHNIRPAIETRTERDPLPTETNLSLSQSFGFQDGDYIRVESANGNLFGEVETISDDRAVTFKGDGLVPIASPSPSPLLLGAEKVSVANFVVRPTPFPSPDATPTPTPTPTAVGADPVSQFIIGRNVGLNPGDYLRFPNLSGQPIVRICSNTNADCDSSSTTKYAGISLVPASEDAAADELVTQITVPGSNLRTLIDAKMAIDNDVSFEKLYNEVVGTNNSTQEFELADVKDFAVGQTVRLKRKDGSTHGRYEYGVVAQVSTSTRRVRLVSPLKDAPSNGDVLDIVKPNDQAYGRVTISQKFSSGNILSNPVLRGNGQEVYVQHGNTLFELNYGSDAAFANSADYLILQSGRLDQSNQALTSLSRSRPLIVNNDKLLTVDSDPTRTTGIFMNRVLLPLESNAERLNDVFPILTPDAQGRLSNRAETQPILLGNTNFAIFGGGNGIAYKLHKDVAW